MKDAVMTLTLFAALIFAPAPVATGRPVEARAGEATEAPGHVWKPGLTIAPVPLNLEGEGRLLVGVEGYVHPQISPLLRTMPWPAYSKMTDEDLRAIYEAFRAIPHAEPCS